MDPCFDDERTLTDLLKFAPNLEEASKLKAYRDVPSEEINKLSEPDQFALQMLQIPQFKQRIECMLFKASFWEKHQQLKIVSRVYISLFFFFYLFYQ